MLCIRCKVIIYDHCVITHVVVFSFFYLQQEAAVIAANHQELLSAWEALKENVS